jgi:hypothetical protein
VVDRAQLNQAPLQTLKGLQKMVCEFVFTPIAAGAYSRMFAPDYEYERPGDRKFNRSVGCIHDAPWAGFECQRYVLLQRAGHENRTPKHLARSDKRL